MRIYISGKITGLELEEAKQNFHNVEQRLYELGYVPINPMKVCEYNPLWEWHHYMVEDIRELFNCEAIVMLHNWRDSKGARIEHSIAMEIGLKIYYPEHHDHLLQR